MQARLRFREFAVMIALNLAVVLAAISYDADPLDKYLPAVVVAGIALYTTYSTERRERVAALVEAQLSSAREAARRSCTCRAPRRCSSKLGSYVSSASSAP